ncbi:DNA-binding transcriptional MocR family regulator [Catenulispora sp. GAS73]|uniref:aminotransferase-like domain-containing protein n=1 Tax=Catenulispora sp. GAS73 TaxID=3156269 RepID=UPI00351573CA
MTENQSNHGFETLLVLDDHGPGPLHARLRRALRAAIAEGRIAPGSAVPPSRLLAADLGCSRWVVTEAYAQLAAEGYLEARSGSATRVRRGPADRPAEAAGETVLAGSPLPPRFDSRYHSRFDLSPGLPDLRMFPRKRWIEALQHAMHDAPHADLGHGDPAGHPTLRATLAEHLTRSRGAAVAAEHVTICGGTTDGLVRILTAMRRQGHTALGVEDPGWDWPATRALIAGAGLTAVPIPVDGHGLRVEALRQAPAVRAVLVAPAHHFPTGVALAPDRRSELIAWARDVDGLVLEEDKDSEFRYDGRPVGALQGMAPSYVALLGSLSKTLAPALRIGWIATPARWTAALAGVRVPANQLAAIEAVRSGARPAADSATDHAADPTASAADRAAGRTGSAADRAADSTAHSEVHSVPELAADLASSRAADPTASAVDRAADSTAHSEADSVPDRAAYLASSRAADPTASAADSTAHPEVDSVPELAADLASSRAADRSADLPATPAAPPPTLDQLAFAHLIRSGAFDRHLRTARRAYRRRRDAFVAELGRQLPECPVSSAAAGLHVILRVPDVSAAVVVEAAAARGVRVGSMAEHCSELHVREDRLILGYGTVADSQVAAAVSALAGAISSVAD